MQPNVTVDTMFLWKRIKDRSIERRTKVADLDAFIGKIFNIIHVYISKVQPNVIVDTIFLWKRIKDGSIENRTNIVV